MIKTRSDYYISLGLACLVLLRSFIPAGFMPDLSALQHGKIEFVVCTGFGSKTIQVDADTLKPLSNHSLTDHFSSHHSSNTMCPFFGLTSIALPILFISALLHLFATPQRFSYTLFLWFTYFNQAAPPRAPPQHYAFI